jgi:hypothetical protein
MSVEKPEKSEKPVRIPKYRRHTSTGQAVVTLGGKDHYLGKHGTQEFREKYGKKVAEYANLPPGSVPTLARPKRPITVLEAADRYLKWSSENQSTVEQAHVRGMLRILVGLYEHELAENIGPPEMREILPVMATKTAARDWSRS